MRCCLDWLEAQGYNRLGIVGTSLGSCYAFIATAHDPRIQRCRIQSRLHVFCRCGLARAIHAPHPRKALNQQWIWIICETCGAPSVRWSTSTSSRAGRAIAHHLCEVRHDLSAGIFRAGRGRIQATQTWTTKPSYSRAAITLWERLHTSTWMAGSWSVFSERRSSSYYPGIPASPGARVLQHPTLSGFSEPIGERKNGSASRRCHPKQKPPPECGSRFHGSRGLAA